LGGKIKTIAIAGIVAFLVMLFAGKEISELFNKFKTGNTALAREMQAMDSYGDFVVAKNE